MQDDGHLSTIFTLLSSKQIRDAVQVARDNNETRLAFLLAQVAGDHHLKHYIRSQLTQWEEGQVSIGVFRTLSKMSMLSALQKHFFAKSFLDIKYFCKMLHLRCLTEF